MFDTVIMTGKPGRRTMSISTVFLRALLEGVLGAEEPRDDGVVGAEAGFSSASLSESLDSRLSLESESPRKQQQCEILNTHSLNLYLRKFLCFNLFFLFIM